MEAILGAVICVVSIVAAVRVLKFAIRMVNKFFDSVEDRY
jgi:hypothetical protein